MMNHELSYYDGGIVMTEEPAVVPPRRAGTEVEQLRAEVQQLRLEVRRLGRALNPWLIQE